MLERAWKLAECKKRLTARTLHPAKFQLSCSFSIMHFHLSGNTLIEYFHSGRLPNSVHPLRCKHCKAQGHFHRHSSYPRKKIFLIHRWYYGCFFIQRFKCSTCGKVFSMIPHFLYKWQQASHKIQEQYVLKNIKNMVHLYEAFSQRTLDRWKQKWRRRADEQRPGILRFLFSKKADIDINIPVYATRNVLTYLESLWRQVPSEVPYLLTAISVLHFGRLRKLPTPQNLSSSILAEVQLR